PALGGQGSPGGPVITKTLLIYALIPTVGGSETGAKLVAYDKATGAVLGDVALPASPLGTPMTYLAGGRHDVAWTLQGGQMVALTLPEGGMGWKGGRGRKGKTDGRRVRL